MKTNRTLFILMLILGMSFSAYTQQTHTITLFVDTNNIVKPDIDQFANFGQEPSIANRDFTVNVNPGDIIIWKGVSSSDPENDIVNIIAINHEGGKNVFGNNTLPGNGDEPEWVIGIVTNGVAGDIQKYKLSFKVLDNGNRRNGTFHIDPKIIVNPE